MARKQTLQIELDVINDFRTRFGEPLWTAVQSGTQDHYAICDGTSGTAKDAVIVGCGRDIEMWLWGVKRGLEMYHAGKDGAK